MHGSAGLHSAMAIKRQRRHREQAKRRAAEHGRERRLSSRTESMDSVEQPAHYHGGMPRGHKFRGRKAIPRADHTFATSIGMLHIGICFLVFGLFLIGSGLLPDDMVTWRGGGWWNELVATGLFVLALGIFLIALNRVVSRREEEDLTDYVQRQLTRSRSGHRLERDVETGCLATKNTRRILERKREDRERGLGDDPVDGELVQVHSPKTLTHQQQNGDLEKILEEDVFERDVAHSGHTNKHEYEVLDDAVVQTAMSNTTTTASLSAGSPLASETCELLDTDKHSNRYY